MGFSIKQLRRQPVATGLFIVLLAAITALLSNGLYMWYSATQSQSRAEQSFTTVAILEYPHVLEPEQAEEISNLPQVMAMDHRELFAAYGHGLQHATSRREGSNFVIVFRPLERVTAGQTAAMEVVEVLHPLRRQFAATSIQTHIDLEPGQDYIATGNPDFEHPGEFKPATAFEFEHSGSIQPIEGELEDFLATPAGQPWSQLLETSSRAERRLTALYTADLESIYAFHQGDATLMQGRLFSAQEYLDKAPVCLISTTTAAKNNLDVGDEIVISFYDTYGASVSSDTGVTAHMSGYSTVWGEEKVQIVGLYSAPRSTGGDWYKIDVDTVVLPWQPAQIIPQFEHENMVSLRLHNGMGGDFISSLEGMDVPISATVYDHGYSKVSSALQSIKTTAQILVAACLLAALVVTILLAYLFVGRQQHSIAIMYSLGSGRKKALTHISFTVAVIAGMAVLIGSVAGHALSYRVTEDLYATAIQQVSNTAYSAVTAGVEAGIQLAVPSGVGLLAAAIMLALTLVLSLAFAWQVLRVEPIQVLTAKED